MRPKLLFGGLSLVAAAIACGAAAIFLSAIHAVLLLLEGQMSFPQGLWSVPLALVLAIFYSGTFSVVMAVLSWGWMALVIMLVYAMGLRKHQQLSHSSSGAFAALLGTLAIASTTASHWSVASNEALLAWSSAWVGLYAGLWFLRRQLRAG